jgi:hypothetical protein
LTDEELEDGKRSVARQCVGEQIGATDTEKSNVMDSEVTTKVLPTSST